MSLGKYKEILKRVALSCDKFASAYTFALIFFFTPYCISTVGGYLMWVLPVACLVPFAVMPLFYTLIHRFSPLLFGRYHLFMPMAGVLSALFSVLVWHASDGAAASVCAVFFGAVMFALFCFAYRYCAFSVRIRLIGDDVASPSVTSGVIVLVGAIAAFCAGYGFYYADRAAMFSNMAYTLAAVGIICAAIQYFASYTEIPKLGSKRYISVGEAFGELYSGLNKRFFASPILILAAFAAAASQVCYASFYTVGAEQAFAVIGALIGAGAVGTVLFKLLISSRNVTAALSVGLTVVSTVFVYVAVSATDAALACLVSAAIFGGLGGAAAMRLARQSVVALKNGMTGGTVFIMLGLVILAAAGVACFAGAAASLSVSSLGAVGFSVGMGIADGAAVSGAVVYFTGLKRKAALPAVGE